MLIHTKIEQTDNQFQIPESQQQQSNHINQHPKSTNLIKKQQKFQQLKTNSKIYSISIPSQKQTNNSKKFQDSSENNNHIFSTKMEYNHKNQDFKRNKEKLINLKQNRFHSPENKNQNQQQSNQQNSLQLQYKHNFPQNNQNSQTNQNQHSKWYQNPDLLQSIQQHNFKYFPFNQIPNENSQILNQQIQYQNNKNQSNQQFQDNNMQTQNLNFYEQQQYSNTDETTPIYQYNSQNKFNSDFYKANNPQNINFFQNSKTNENEIYKQLVENKLITNQNMRNQIPIINYSNNQNNYFNNYNIIFNQQKNLLNQNQNNQNLQYQYQPNYYNNINIIQQSDLQQTQYQNQNQNQNQNCQTIIELKGYQEMNEEEKQQIQYFQQAQKNSNQTNYNSEQSNQFNQQLFNQAENYSQQLKQIKSKINYLTNNNYNKDSDKQLDPTKIKEIDQYQYSINQNQNQPNSQDFNDDNNNSISKKQKTQRQIAKHTNQLYNNIINNFQPKNNQSIQPDYNQLQQQLQQHIKQENQTQSQLQQYFQQYDQQQNNIKSQIYTKDRIRRFQKKPQIPKNISTTHISTNIFNGLITHLIKFWYKNYKCKLNPQKSYKNIQKRQLENKETIECECKYCKDLNLFLKFKRSQKNKNITNFLELWSRSPRIQTISEDYFIHYSSSNILIKFENVTQKYRKKQNSKNDGRHMIYAYQSLGIFLWGLDNQDIFVQFKK